MESAPTVSVIKSKIGRGYPSADICKRLSRRTDKLKKIFASELRFQLFNACRANTLAVKIDHVICVVAENTSRLILLQYYTIVVCEDLNSVLLLNVQHLSDFDRKNYSSKFIDLAHYTGGLHKVSPLHKIIRGARLMPQIFGFCRTIHLYYIGFFYLCQYTF